MPKNNISNRKMMPHMRRKLATTTGLVMLAFGALCLRIYAINRDNGDKYTRQVLSQQEYDSIVLPYKRGDILDSKGTTMASSEKVYNVILDSKLAGVDEKTIQATTQALAKCFRLNASELTKYIKDNPTSQYYILSKKLTYDEIASFVELQNDTKNNPDIKGVWFEEEYIRVYPNNSMACDVIGWTDKDFKGHYGLEEYYDDILRGTNGREYGYLNEESALERTTKPAVDGNSIVTTLDANIQSIVEKYLEEFNNTYKNAYRDGNGAQNTGCIIMNIHTGEIMAMASYPFYNLNDIYNTDPLIGTTLLDVNGKAQDEVITEDTLKRLDTDTKYANLNNLWKNFSINNTYEPGSVSKVLTVAGALESGKISGNETYFCGGYLEKGGHEIHCHNRLGDGMLTVKQAVEKSCNVALMHIGEAEGKTNFLQFQQLFNLGLKTNLDLAGESRTASLVYNEKTMGEAELATSTFGQGFNVTMIQMISAFSSIINGGYYYEPHIVSKIISSDGTTVKNIEPRLLKQTVSESTSDKIIDYCNGVVTEGTGTTARPAGYAIGGKTGTAEMAPRTKRNYVVSFMGYAPANNPDIAIYVVVDRPNAAAQDDAKYATRIVRKILTEVLPYLGYPMTEELSEKEATELEENKLLLHAPKTVEADANNGQENENGEKVTNEEGTTITVTEGSNLTEGIQKEGSEPTLSPEEEALNAQEEEWKKRLESYEKDPETGYLIEPGTGLLIDPQTGALVEGDSYME